MGAVCWLRAPHFFLRLCLRVCVSSCAHAREYDSELYCVLCARARALAVLRSNVCAQCAAETHIGWVSRRPVHGLTHFIPLWT